MTPRLVTTLDNMQSKLIPILGFILLFYGVSLIDSVAGEVCFQDANCTIGEYCNISAQTYEANPYRRKPPFGRTSVPGVCVKCFDCAAVNREAKRAKSQECAKNITDCGVCTEAYQPVFSHSGYHVDCKPRYLVTVNISALNSSRLLGEASTEVEGESLQSTGTILGAVAIGLVGIAAIAFLTVFGVKYFKGRKQKKNKKAEDEENATTTELQELKPTPLPTINEHSQDAAQSEELQEI